MNTTREHLKSMFTETAEKVVKEEVEKHFDSAEDFVDFLQMTLIPDLRASGTIETAKDFEKGVNLITSGTRDDEFIAFLQNTLIPDLRASGIIHTAEDFEEMVEWMKDIEKKVYPDGGSPDDALGDEEFSAADHKDIEGLVSGIQAQLDAHGLLFQTDDRGDDQFWFRIVKGSE